MSSSFGEHVEKVGSFRTDGQPDGQLDDEQNVIRKAHEFSAQVS